MKTCVGLSEEMGVRLVEMLGLNQQHKRKVFFESEVSYEEPTSSPMLVQLELSMRVGAMGLGVEGSVGGGEARRTS